MPFIAIRNTTLTEDNLGNWFYLQNMFSNTRQSNFWILVLEANGTFLLGRVEVDASIPICRGAKHRDDKGVGNSQPGFKFRLRLGIYLVFKERLYSSLAIACLLGTRL